MPWSALAPRQSRWRAANERRRRTAPPLWGAQGASCGGSREDGIEARSDVGVVLLILDGDADRPLEGIGPGRAALGQHGRRFRPIDGLRDAGRLGERLTP